MESKPLKPFKAPPTIRHVAEEAKVSRATVSRAFGAPGLLRDETVATVRAVAERLGYVPNHAARALSTGRARQHRACRSGHHQFVLRGPDARRPGPGAP